MHREAISVYGGSLGIRDLGRLEAAVAAPQSGSGDVYYHADIWEMSANAFLRMNDLTVVVDEDAYADLVLAVASGSTGKAEAAEFLRRGTVPAVDQP